MGTKTRSILTLTSLLCLSGTIVLLFLLLLAGAYGRDPLQRIFLLQADTRGIPNAPDGTCHWTLYNHCASTRDGQSTGCTANTAAYPFSPARNFATAENIPRDFLERPRTYYYLSRFLFAFLLITLFFSLLAFVCTVLAAAAAAFIRRRNLAPLATTVSAAAAAAALFSMCFSASVFTACFVMAQRAFRADGRSARIGVKATAFVWLCVALLAVCTAALSLAVLMGRTGEDMVEKKERRRRRRKWVSFGKGGEKAAAAATEPGEGEEYVNRDSYVSASESQRRIMGGYGVAGTTA